MLLGNPITLSCGLRARVRLPLSTDAPAVLELLGRLGLEAEELEVRRALRFDPRRRTVLVATALIDGHTVLLGLAAGVRDAETVLAEHPEVRRLLAAALRERAATLAA